MSKLWLNAIPTHCQHCEGMITNEFYDCRTRSGYWAILCPICFNNPGLGKLGTGYGQRYTKQEKGFVKTGG